MLNIYKGEQPTKFMIEKLLGIPAEDVANQLLKKPNIKYKKLYNHFNVTRPYSLIQLDLCEVTNDNGNKYIFCAIDVASRYKWAMPLKNKTATTILDEFKRMNIPIDKIEVIQTDGGSEFKGAFGQFLKSHDIEHFINQPGHHPSLVENFNLNLVRRLYKTQTINEIKTGEPNYTWVRDLEETVQNMNYDEINPSTKKTPAEAIKMEEVKQPIEKFSDEDMKARYPNGAIVRRLLKIDQYMDNYGTIKIEKRRSTDVKWSLEMYYVYDAFNDGGSGIYYHRLIPITKSPSTKNCLQHRYTYWQLQEVPI
jgi:hypothetical protein